VELGLVRLRQWPEDGDTLDAAALQQTLEFDDRTMA
jgi:hypothetical protein